MPHPVLVRHDDRIEIRSPMHAGMRIALAVPGLFPLLAPYELLIKTDWAYFLHPFFFFAALVSAGAVALGALLFFSAVAGLSSSMVFDRRAATFSYAQQAPVVRRSTQVWPLTAVRNTELGVREWSDGAPSYYLRVILQDGSTFESGSSWVRDEIDRIREQVEQFLAAPGAA